MLLATSASICLQYSRNHVQGIDGHPGLILDWYVASKTWFEFRYSVNIWPEKLRISHQFLSQIDSSTTFLAHMHCQVLLEMSYTMTSANQTLLT